MSEEKNQVPLIPGWNQVGRGVDLKSGAFRAGQIYNDPNYDSRSGEFTEIASNYIKYYPSKRDPNRQRLPAYLGATPSREIKLTEGSLMRSEATSQLSTADVNVEAKLLNRWLCSQFGASYASSSKSQKEDEWEWACDERPVYLLSVVGHAGFFAKFYKDCKELPESFDSTTRPTFDRFIGRYGTHVVDSGKFGGHIDLLLEKHGNSSESKHEVGVKLETTVLNAVTVLEEIKGNASVKRESEEVKRMKNSIKRLYIDPSLPGMPAMNFDLLKEKYTDTSFVPAWEILYSNEPKCIMSSLTVRRLDIILPNGDIPKDVLDAYISDPIPAIQPMTEADRAVRQEWSRRKTALQEAIFHHLGVVPPQKSFCLIL